MIQFASKPSTLALAGMWAIGVVTVETSGTPAGERHTYVAAEALYTGHPPNSDDDDDLATTGSVSSSVSPSAGGASCTANATSGFKKVKGGVTLSKGGNLIGGGNSDAYARSMDRVTFNTSQVPPGTMVNVQGVIRIDSLIEGEQSCAPSGQIGWLAGCTLTLYYGPNGANFVAHEAFGLIDSDPESKDFTFPDGEVIVNLELANGVENQLILDVFAYASMSAIGQCTGNAKALGNSFTWMGVIGATTGSEGNPITEYTLTDEFGNDWTTPPSAADITSDGQVNLNDLLEVINGWGPCAEQCPPSCAADIAPAEGDCAVNINDLLLVINSWGS